MFVVRKLFLSARTNVVSNIAAQPAAAGMYTTPTGGYMAAFGGEKNQKPTSSLEEQLGLPEKPKKPMPPFFTFGVKVLKDFRAANRDKPLSVNERMKMSKDLWDKVDKEEKVKMHKQFVEDLAKYNAAMDQYMKSLSEEDRERLKNARQEKRTLKKMRSEKKHSNKPQWPASPYIYFLRDKYAQTKYSSLHAREFGDEWRNLKPEEKAKYEAKYDEAKKEYEKAMSEWEGRMIREGKEHLVRVSMLPQLPKKGRTSTKAAQKASTASSSVD